MVIDIKDAYLIRMKKDTRFKSAYDYHRHKRIQGLNTAERLSKQREERNTSTLRSYRLRKE